MRTDEAQKHADWGNEELNEAKEHLKKALNHYRDAVKAGARYVVSEQKMVYDMLCAMSADPTDYRGL